MDVLSEVLRVVRLSGTVHFCGEFTRWRMHLARHLLRDSALDIGEIAGRVGYDSDAAFNRAFRRLVGAPPATWRQATDPRSGKRAQTG